MNSANINKQPSVSTITSTETQQSEDIIEYTEDTTQNYGWKSVLLLQFQPQFEIMIMISIYFSYICSLLDVTFAYSTPTENIPSDYTAIGISFIYCFDMIYLIDILSMIAYKNTDWEEVRHLYNERHMVLVFLDIISTIPLDAIYYSLTLTNTKVTYILRLRYVLRIFRFINRINRLKDTVGHNAIFIGMIEFLTGCSLALVTISCIVYLLGCENESCNYKDTVLFFESLYVASTKITSRGHSLSHTGLSFTSVLFVFTNLLAFIGICGFTVGKCLVATIHVLKRKNIYLNFRNLIMNKLNRIGCKDVLLLSTSKTFFDEFWRNRTGIITEQIHFHIIPEIMAKEISLDITWDCLKHSHLFRDQEVHFLRYVAPLIKSQFMLPGEVIYKSNQFKSAMVYVAAGVIQILSEQDGETPILSFSAGTCIGESTLFLDYPSTCTVICQSCCEVNILYRKDFLKVFTKYPKECAHLFDIVKNRYNEVKQYQSITNYVLHNKTQQVKLLTLKWVETTLDELLTDDTNLPIESKNTKKEFDDLVFCTDYLDMLVTTEQLQLVTDTVFLRQSCPCILQPDSFILTIWNTLMSLTILIFIFMYPYYASFNPHHSALYYAFTYTMTTMYVFDLYLTISTAIRTRDGIITEISKITLAKLNEISFCIDLVACIPIELFALFITLELHPQTTMILQMPRLLKCYRIQALFNDNLTNFAFNVRLYLKNVIYMIILIYYIAAVLYMKVCYRLVCDTDNNFLNFLNKVSNGTTYETITIFFYIATQTTTSLGMTLPVEGTLISYHYFVIIQFLVTLFYIYFLTNTSSNECSRHFDTLRLHEYISDIMTMLQTWKVSARLQNYISKHIRGQLQYNKGIDILYSSQILNKHYHPILSKESQYNAFEKLLKSVPLFNKLSDDVIEQISTAFHVKMFVPGEVIAYAGEVCQQLHIIQHGFCEMTEPSKERNSRIIGPGFTISAVETCFEIPVAVSVITITHCQILSASSEQLMYILQLHPEVLFQIKNIVNELLVTMNLNMLSGEQDVDTDFYKERKNEERSFRHFGYQLRMDTQEHKDFHNLFEKLRYFSFLKYMFMRHTIRPYGKFIHYWEISRCIFAFTTGILFLIPPICSDCTWYYIFLILDITAWIDIYVRHYICYFNDEGIEITHPLKTALYYWKHGFLIDLLGVLPFESIIPLFNLKFTNRARVFLRTLRLLQVHRIIKGIQYLDKQIISTSKIWSLIKYLPIIVLTINSIGSIIINSICEFDSTIEATQTFSKGVRCYPSTWLSQSKFEKPLSAARTQLYGLLFSTVTIIGPSIGGFNVHNIKEIILINILTLLGFWYFVYLSAKIIAANLFRNADLTLYQEAMSNLVKFLSSRSIDKELKEEVIKHFEYIWRKKRGKDVHDIIKNFNYALQEDLLYDVYGKAMKESEIFKDASTSFFRSLLLKAKHEIIINKGIICKVNDIHGKIYFIYKGEVQVLGPDYNNLLVLPTGSLFGNLQNCALIRQSLTMVAKGHIELLSIESVVFHDILTNYHKLKHHFYNITAINTDYLLGSEQEPFHQESLTFKQTLSSAKNSVQKLVHKFNTIKESKARVGWDIILIVVCYVSPLCEVCQLSVQTVSSRILAIIYTFDLLFAVNIYLNFHTAYENEVGLLVTDSKKIAIRYIKSPNGFIPHVLSVIPFEIISLCFKSSVTRRWVWSYCRCNRMIRLFFLESLLQSKNQQLNVNVYVTRTVSLLLRIAVILVFLSLSIVVFSCLTPTFNISPPITCKWKNLTSVETLGIYVNEFSVAVYIFTASSIPDYFPNASHLILLTIVLLIAARYLTTIFVAETSATFEILLHNRIKYEDNINILKDYMIREQTSPALFERIWLYVRLLWKYKRGQQFPTLLEEAPYYLREAVLNSLFGYHLRKHKILSRCHMDLTRQMVAQMRPRTFFSGDYVTFINDTDECMYFIHEGGVDALSEDEMFTEKIEKTLSAGEMFGYEQSIHQNGHEYTYRANARSLILILNRKDWMNLLDYFPASKVTIFGKKYKKKRKKL